MPTEARPSHPHLGDLAQHVRNSKSRIEAFLERPDDQLSWKPDESAWSAMEVAEHIRITNSGYERVVGQAVAAADKSDIAAPYRPGWFARMFLGMVSPDPKFRIKTVAAATPAPGKANRQSIRELADQQDQLLELLVEADGIDINKTRFISPLSKWVKFSVGEGLTVIIMHQLRHLQQIDRLMAKLEERVRSEE